MVKHVLFLKWWLIMGMTAVGTFFAHKFNFFTEVYNGDFTFISFGIMAGFLLVSLWCGVKTYFLSQAYDEYCVGLMSNPGVIERIKNQEEVGWFSAGIFTALGFLGTAIGMVYALHGFIGVDPTNTGTLQGLIDTLVYGVSTALYTTIVGLICSLLVQLQYFNLGYARRRMEETL